MSAALLDFWARRWTRVKTQQILCQGGLSENEQIQALILRSAERRVSKDEGGSSANWKASFETKASPAPQDEAVAFATSFVMNLSGYESERGKSLRPCESASPMGGSSPRSGRYTEEAVASYSGKSLT